jgi:hypothetical protein
MGLLERENGILTQQMRQLEGVVAILVKVCVLFAKFALHSYSEKRGRAIFASQY